MAYSRIAENEMNQIDKIIRQVIRTEKHGCRYSTIYGSRSCQSGLGVSVFDDRTDTGERARGDRCFVLISRLDQMNRLACCNNSSSNRPWRAFIHGFCIGKAINCLQAAAERNEESWRCDLD